MEQNIAEKKAAYVSAFNDEAFQITIGCYRNEIEKVLNRFINEQKKTVLSIGSRIKSSRSFEEKLIRKDFIHEWGDYTSASELQKEICSKLPDLIGFRITCLFYSDEENLFNDLYSYIGKGKDGVTLDEKPKKDSESLRQKNGHIIYKMTGKYDPGKNADPVCFEVQIKSTVHNIWGEVEHKTIYKGKQYEMEMDHKKTMTDEIYNVLAASDKQLESLFNRNHTESDLVKALFAEQTRGSVSKKLGTEFLAVYYKGFFELLGQKLDTNIKEYVALKLENGWDESLKKKIQVSANKDQIVFIVKTLRSDFKEYYLNAIKSIADEIIVLRDEEEFLAFVADVILGELKAQDEITGDDETVNEDSFGDDPDSTYDDIPSNDNLLQDAVSILNDKLKEAKKGEK